ncbi:MAG: PilZ domain-containing protein [Planctomycetes bacterium]|nr:PilZ domain-containing protein [Planctomycetota bacterium]
MSAHIPFPETEFDPRTSNEERRGAVRVPAEAQALCRPLADEKCEPWRAGIRDVSSIGVGLVLPGPVDAGTLLHVELSNKHGAKIRPLLARVVHSEQEGEGSWLVGCAFLSELDESQLRSFQAQRVRPARQDGRRWIRFPCHVETVCYTSETVPGERRSARILNVSAGGIGLLLPCQFSEGTLLQLEIPSEAARLALIRVIRVVEHSAGGWFLGCEFADQLGAEELQELLA